MTFDELFDAFFPVADQWVDVDPPPVEPIYLHATLSGIPMFRDLYGRGPNSWGAVIPTMEEILRPVVLAPICYSTQGTYGGAGTVL